MGRFRHTSWVSLAAHPTTVSSVIKYFMLSVTVAGIATTIVYFHESYVNYSETHAQFHALASSSLCTDPRQRIASVHVNQCDTAQRFVDGTVLSPLTHAFLDTLESFSLCGKGGTKCTFLISNIRGASMQISLLLVTIIVAVAWIVVQKMRLRHGL